MVCSTDYVVDKTGYVSYNVNPITFLKTYCKVISYGVFEINNFYVSI